MLYKKSAIAQLGARICKCDVLFFILSKCKGLCNKFFFFFFFFFFQNFVLHYILFYMFVFYFCSV